MGTDIHTVLQVKKGKKWETIATDIYDGRNYALFSVLAGVRGQEEPIAEPRGLPPGFVVDEDNDHRVTDAGGFIDSYWMGYHSHSWLTLAEIVDYDSGGDLEAYIKCLAYITAKMTIVAYENGLELEEVRLVFGFDS